MLGLLLSVGVGGGLGAMARFLVQRSLLGVVDGSYWSIIICNVVGSFLMGLMGLWLSVLAENVGAEGAGETLKMFLLTGFLGGFTTFSAFSQQSVDLLASGRIGLLMFYVVGGVGISFLMLWLGWRLGLVLWER